MEVKNCVCKRLERLMEKSEELSLENDDLYNKLEKSEQKLEKIKEIMKSKRLYSTDEIIKIIESEDELCK